MRAFSDAPNRIKRGFAKIMHKAVKTTANVQTIVKLVFIIVLAALSSLMPLFIEKAEHHASKEIGESDCQHYK